ncbi:MAG TPA: hypothetical protein VGO47_13045 [Chlamydiales bacterium]|nr:hypothetical protein [Chlamydiales bacterium]
MTFFIGMGYLVSGRFTMEECLLSVFTMNLLLEKLCWLISKFPEGPPDAEE